MTGSESPTSPSTPDDDTERVSLANEDFDFADVAITERSYYNRLDDILAHEFVSDLSHSLALNEIAVAIDSAFTGHISTDDFPPDITIRHIGEWTTEDDADDRLCLELSTAKLFCAPDDRDEFFPGTYDPEAMAALAVELNQFTEVETATPTCEATGEALVDTPLSTDLQSTFLFDDVLTFLGYNIREVWIDAGTINRLRFGFSERRVWSRDEVYAAFQSDKVRGYRNALLDASDAETLPCQHEATPTIGLVSDLPTATLAGFPTVLVGEAACHEVSVEDADDAILTIADWPDGIEPEESDDEFTTMAIERGYLCDACDVYYPFVDSDLERANQTALGAEQGTGAVVTVNDEQYVFVYVPLAARPIGHRDAFVEE